MRSILVLFLIAAVLASYWYTRSDDIVISEVSYFVPLLVDKPVPLEDLRTDLESKLRREFQNVRIDLIKYDIELAIMDNIAGVDVISYGKIDIGNGVPGLKYNSLSLKTIGKRRYHEYIDVRLSFGELNQRLTVQNQKLHGILKIYLNKY